MRHLGIGFDRVWLGALVDIGDPGLADAGHRGQHTAARDEQAPVFELRIGIAAQIALHVIDVADFGGFGKLIGCFDAADAVALAAEQRLHDDGPAGLIMREFAGGLDAFGGACQWDRQAGHLEQECGRRFIDAAFDDAGVVPYAHAAFAQRMQDAEAERDLFKAAGGNGADEGAIGQVAIEAWDMDP